MDDLRTNRVALGLSQSRLARLAGVSRFKLCMFELGSGKLADDEQAKVRAALQGEAARLQTAAAGIQLAHSAREVEA